MYGMAGLARVLAVVVMLAALALAVVEVARANWPETWQAAGERAMACAQAQAAARGVPQGLASIEALRRANAVCDAQADTRATRAEVLAQAGGTLALGLILLLAATAVRLGIEVQRRFDELLARARGEAPSQPASARSMDVAARSVERERLRAEAGTSWSAALSATRADLEARRRGEG